MKMSDAVAKAGMVGGVLTAAAAQAAPVAVLSPKAGAWVSVIAALGALFSALAHTSPVAKSGPTDQPAGAGR